MEYYTVYIEETVGGAKKRDLIVAIENFNGISETFPEYMKIKLSEVESRYAGKHNDELYRRYL